MWNPFRQPVAPRITKRFEQLELELNDVQDTIEKVLYQQKRILGKVNARHKRDLQDADSQLDIEEQIVPPTFNGMTFPPPHGDPKALMRQQAAELRRLR